ncbi:lipoprotein signal peptidase [gamma proteobacterium HIMB55]|nr:lipoprotein signal peptidase [gamma proteobacterium HIMB55]
MSDAQNGQSGQAAESKSLVRRLLSNPWVGFVLAAVVIGLDQYTKALASAELQYRVPVEITSWFDLMLAHNTGAAFSFLASAGGWQRWFLAGVALVVSLVVSVWLTRLKHSEQLLGIALGLVLGGGLGNLIDRVSLGYVVDFISWHYNDWYWPAFNIADSAICVGAVLLVWDSFYGESSKQEQN